MRLNRIAVSSCKIKGTRLIQNAVKSKLVSGLCPASGIPNKTCVSKTASFGHNALCLEYMLMYKAQKPSGTYTVAISSLLLTDLIK
jgi:hypothetical protein